MNLIDTHQKIYIAGHNGMVGRAILRTLKKNNYTNLLCPKRKDLDLTDTNQVAKWFKKNKPEIVILAAAKVGGIFANNKYPTDFLLDNLKIQTNIIEHSWKNETKRLLFLGSSCIYPKETKQPIKEEYLLESQLESTNQWYALAKIAGLKLCEALRLQHNFDAISLMPTNLYGPGDNYHPNNSHVLPALIKKFCEAIDRNDTEVICWGSGKPYREFLHVDDLGDACLFALEKWKPGSKNSAKLSNNEHCSFLNIGTGLEISIKELATLVAEISGFKGNIKWDKSKPDGTFRKRLDTSRANKMGWKAKISLKDGIKKTIKDYKQELKNDKLRSK